ncbi:hypothetical protein Y032_0253g259 [Ancylostoma ceylanicum]|uniref:Uncharacterized protein n=1 Tax=Ancylostoma ceylanicum TaxID=53326 RepID=A0A016SCN0_9BILA|nr:hypothetical protein Y032_0253g259 [Ancylostoma ceylanicum]
MYTPTTAYRFSFHRYPMMDWINKKVTCNLVGAGDHIVVLIKHDVTNPRSEKYVGTYSKAKDMAFYMRGGSQKKVLRNVKSNMKSGNLGAQMLEVICEMEFAQAGRGR